MSVCKFHHHNIAIHFVLLLFQNNTYKVFGDEK